MEIYGKFKSHETLLHSKGNCRPNAVMHSDSDRGIV